MAFSTFAIRKVFVNPESAFASSSATEGDYIRVPVVNPDWKPTEGTIERAVAQSRLTSHSAIVGRKGGTFTFRVHLEGLTTNDGAAQVTVTPWLDECLLACGLTKLAGTGLEKTGVDSDADDVVLASTAAAKFKLGGMLGYKLDSDGLLYTRLIKQIATTTVTVKPPWTSGSADLDSIVTSGGDLTIFSPATYWAQDGLAAPLGNGVISDPGTVSFVVVGSGYEFTLKGCRGNVKLLGEGETAMLEFTFQVCSFATSSLAPTASMPTAKTSLTLPGNAKVWWGDDVAATADTIPCRDVAFDFGVQLAEKAADQGTEGRAGWAVTGHKPVASFKPYWDTAFLTAKSAASAYLFAFQIGTSPTNCVSVGLNKAQIVDYPAPEDLGGLVGQSINLTAVDAGTATLDGTATQMPDAVMCFF